MKFKSWPEGDQFVRLNKSALSGIERLNSKIKASKSSKDINQCLNLFFRIEENLEVLNSALFKNEILGIDSKLSSHSLFQADINQARNAEEILARGLAEGDKKDYLSARVKNTRLSHISDIFKDLGEVVLKGQRSALNPEIKAMNFELYKSLSKIYRSSTLDHLDLIKERLGIDINEQAVIHFAEEIRNIFKSQSDLFLSPAKRSFADTLNHEHVTLRGNADAEIEIINFFSEFDLEFGEHAKKVLQTKKIIDQSCFYSVSSYKRVPCIFVSEVRSLLDEVILVHETAHAIHSMLMSSRVPFEKTLIRDMELEFFSIFFEIAYLFRQLNNARTDAHKKKVRLFINKYILIYVYIGAFNIEFENELLTSVGETINSPQELSEYYQNLLDKYFSSITLHLRKEKDSWFDHQSIFDPQSELNYLVSFVAAFNVFSRMQSFRIDKNEIKNQMCAGNSFDLNIFFDVADFIDNPEKYITKIIHAIKVVL